MMRAGKVKNVFILSTGRSGTVSFVAACEHFSGYTAGHETLWGELGDKRFEYPEMHIEADNRLSWHLGMLDKLYGDAPIYIHLLRNEEKVAVSYSHRNWFFGIATAYARAIIQRPLCDVECARDMVRDVNANIELFLKDKSRVVTVEIENASHGITELWKMLGEPDGLEAALKELESPKNTASRYAEENNWRYKVKAVLKYFKYYIKSV